MTVRGYEEDTLSLPKIEKLDTIEEYEALSSEERQERYLDVVDYFVTFAVNYSNKVKRSTDFLLKEVKDFEAIGNYEIESDAQKAKEVKLARKLVEGEEFCGTVLERLVSFCITPGNIEGVKDKKLLDILNKWKDSIGNLSASNISDSDVYVLKPQGLNVVFEQVLERLFVDGDSVVSEIWSDEVEMDGDTYFLPYKMNIHDTLRLNYDADLFKKTGQEKIYKYTEGSPFPGVRGGNKLGIPLFHEGQNDFQYTTHLKLKPKTFKMWGSSFFKRAFPSVAAKKRMEALEIHTVEGIINRLTILMAGKIDPETESGIVAPHRLSILESLISQPKTNNLLLWPGDDLKFIDIGPSNELLQYENKYKSSNERILVALGFPRVLIDGAESSTENWQKFLGVISSCEHIRSSFIVPWINNILRKIAIKNGYEDEYPRWSFTRMRLYDLTQLLEAVKVFYDRGLMSELTALASGDLDHGLESIRREYEAEYGMVQKHGVPSLPFSKKTDDKGGQKGVSDKKVEDVEKSTKLAASINDRDRDSLVATFKIYLETMHDYYTRKLVAYIRSGNYEVDNLFFVYRDHMKKDVKKQMNTLFSQEIQGRKLDNKLLEAAYAWIDSFIDGYIEDMSVEVEKVIESNVKQRPSLIPDLIAGIMGAFKNKRLRLYSSSIYNKAVSAGEMTARIERGEDRIKWTSAMTDRTCEWCRSMHGKTMSLNDFFQHFPPHPDCECWGNTTTDELDAFLPTKDSKNWSAILK